MRREREITIAGIKEFAGAVKATLVRSYPETKIEISEMLKNNGVWLTGISIYEKNYNITPNIYLERFFEEYKRGRELEEICREISDIHEKEKRCHGITVYPLSDFQKIKDNICFKLVNAERNKALLQDHPHRRYHDLAIVYFVLVSKENGVASIKIRNEMLSAWGIDEEILHRYAEKNTSRHFEVNVGTLQDLLAEILEGNAKYSEEEIEEIRNAGFYDGKSILYFISNKCYVNGASAMLYDGVLKRFAEELGADFYILPSSIHEVLIMPIHPDFRSIEILDMIRSINRNLVDREEILSDNMYRYRAEMDSVELIR